MIVKPAAESIVFNASTTVPGDKSISHRSIFFSSLSENTVRIENFLFSEDCLRTIEAFINLGIEINCSDSSVTVTGKGLQGLSKPSGNIYAGNSGTTARLMLGLLSAQNFKAVISGDESLSKRPMKRVTEPLGEMGADFKGNFLPIEVKGSRLRPIDYRLVVASAQVKSAILIAGMYADGVTAVHQDYKTRDHTERMLKSFGAPVSIAESVVSISKTDYLNVVDFAVPGDASSAAFLVALCLLSSKAKITVRNVGINPTRLGFINVLKRMGAKIDLNIVLKESDSEIGEPSADITVTSSNLQGTTVRKEEIPLLIDELPILFLLFALAEGRSYVENVSELKVKETDRVNSVLSNLRRMGADVETTGEDVKITGVDRLNAGELLSFSDHRTAMVNIIAAVFAKGNSYIDDIECINISYPGFVAELKSILSDQVEFR
ncbi:MAG: 3-phosphoshikimate 1-carboxyvinyltransferase [Candidatus Omnitrophica bacterium]|nr:3-phosphoshikimate 1-carboxyvinyltransferase [Candidatus Omnitrophota bacterium]